MKNTMEELKQLQQLPLSVKIAKTQQRIKEWVDHFGIDGVYISFSGGKDSTVLLDICRKLYPQIKAVYIDTGLEYPEIKKFVKKFENVEIIKPKMTFKQVIEKYGYPFISKPVSNTLELARKNILEGKMHTTRVRKIMGTMDDGKGGKSQFNYEKYKFMLDSPFLISDKCCVKMKHDPINTYEKQTGRVPILGQMTQESLKRRNGWLRTGCNAFNSKKPQSNPIAFWLENDILQYIKENNIEIASVYGDVVECGDICGQTYIFSETKKEYKTTGCTRTGCMFCGYGCHLNSDTRFTDMKKHIHKYMIG